LLQRGLFALKLTDLLLQLFFLSVAAQNQDPAEHYEQPVGFHCISPEHVGERMD
jgi:hypothetical protein